MTTRNRLFIAMSLTTLSACSRTPICSSAVSCFREAARLAPPAVSGDEESWSARSAQAAAATLYGRACQADHVEACRRVLLYWQVRRAVAAQAGARARGDDAIGRLARQYQAALTARDARTGRVVWLDDHADGSRIDAQQRRWWRALTRSAFAAAEREGSVEALVVFRQQYPGAIEAPRARRRQAALELAAIEPAARAARDPAVLYAYSQRYPDLHLEEPVVYALVMGLPQGTDPAPLPVGTGPQPGQAERITAAIAALQRYRTQYQPVVEAEVIERRRLAQRREADLAFARASDCELSNDGALAEYCRLYPESQHVADAAELAFQCAAHVSEPTSRVSVLRRYQRDFPRHARTTEARSLEIDAAAAIALSGGGQARWRFVADYGLMAPHIAEVRAAIARDLLAAGPDASSHSFEQFLHTFPDSPEARRVGAARARALRREQAEARRAEAEERREQRRQDAAEAREARDGGRRCEWHYCPGPGLVRGRQCTDYRIGCVNERTGAPCDCN